MLNTFQCTTTSWPSFYTWLFSLIFVDFLFVGEFIFTRVIFYVYMCTYLWWHIPSLYVQNAHIEIFDVLFCIYLLMLTFLLITCNASWHILNTRVFYDLFCLFFSLVSLSFYVRYLMSSSARTSGDLFPILYVRNSLTVYSVHIPPHFLPILSTTSSWPILF